MGDKTVLEKLDDWFFSDNTGVEQFVEEFAKKNKDVFDLEAEEHKHEYTTVYKDFQDQFEKKIEAFLASNGHSSEDLVEAVKVEQAKNPDGAMGIDTVGVILATLEYDVFLQMIADAKSRFA
mmetsp:Transcript_38497/g.56597  ORF Transcript_38497/g.56597 Transcript_38497/m.56597 type:complete len:122 (+) Transcript_38497:117-482(+)|eukprot:CAMPEP_0179435268 /NCGR_PEP_ID=MMETSP0799-20121207/19417_1 /TAXON_ID=46947 /ORGANISM="Geminigera cryophila, Strain CCMP2564" /LENGTH=121 /DNA_ID=CAMNT_0021214547 /DNA_START=34 /DNA_END=399 /DNA_ORIENTATION=-